MQPVFFINAARYVAFPPGAEAISNIRSFSWGARAIQGRKEDAAMII
jgi:hypothetical protein